MFDFLDDIKYKVQEFDSTRLLTTIMRGIFLGLTYFTVTKAQDTTFENMLKFTMFYTILSFSAYLVEIDTKVVTGAFVTKAIFSLLDDRINV